MSPFETSSLVALTLFAGTGCTTKFADTEGRLYEAACDTSRNGIPECSVRRVDGTSEILDRGGRYLAICEQSGDPFSCRHLACETGNLCQLLGGDDFDCVEKRCLARSKPLTTEDRVRACLAGTGPYRRTPEQLERITLARACTGSCALPATCTASGMGTARKL
jgi:hypothetical protein